MPWPGATARVVLLVFATLIPPGIFSTEEGNVGCLFSKRLCLEGEWCFDDYAFGRCLQGSGNIDQDDFYRYNLEREILHEISRELKRLFTLGYRWSHAYTQCRLQTMLYAAKNDLLYENNACSNLADQDLEGALNALEDDDPLDPREMAIVKYTPSIENPHADFADEVYYPPAHGDPQQALREKILPTNVIDILDMEDPYAQYDVGVSKRTWIPQMHRRSLPPSYYDGPPDAYRSNKDINDDLVLLPELRDAFNRINEDDVDDAYIKELRTLYFLKKYLNDLNEDEVLNSNLKQEDYDNLIKLIGQQDLGNAIQEYLLSQNQEEQGDDDDGERGPFERFTMTYNTPSNFRAGWESRDVFPYGDGFPESRIYFDENDEQEDGTGEYGSGFDRAASNFNNAIRNDDNKLLNTNGFFRELNMKHARQPHPSIYTEGGVVSALDPKTEEPSEESINDVWKDDLDELLTKYNVGFKRPERLDVKKPGPLFEQAGKNARPKEHEDVGNMLHSMMKRPIGAHPYPSHEVFDVDTDYVYVEFKNSVKTWKEGEDIIKNISNLLKLESSAFTHGRVDRNEVTFKVVPNSKGLNATDVAQRIDSIKEDLKARTGVEVTAAGIGDKTKMQTVVATRLEKENQFYIVIFMVCGVLGAMVVASSLLILIRRHLKAKDKLQGLANPDTEASKDYQDLCRARMASKGQQPSSETVHGRITSLSRESEQSHSSRSSTSSWSEEPALHNMDISTGHMVLSYMEDHLKNKFRLEQEWVALCAYVAEPCETTVALQKDNIEKNRYPDIIPYDHARVVLNELSNATSSDYINASSITDHDPRNPAYIATQGPLPHTAPDFWQLIWEQGAVVIVMLTRLTEGGAAMCHRYWPEEGSEVYHIYEVHLVSEHIWCDDYLVRSFYLKNVRTGETRTVTQFHFLSWPENGVPASTKALLEFRRKVNKSYRGRSCPIVVHCSDGAGRAGTYCLIDMVLSRMAKGAKEIDIAATLEHLRDQRPKMVATKQQFEFVLTAVAEEVHAILKALPPQPASAPTEKEKP